MVRVHFGPPLQKKRPKWGVSSAGRAPALQAGGHRFDPGTLHHKRLTEVASKEEASLSFLKKRFKECTLKTEHCYYECNYEKATVEEKLLKFKG